MSATIVINTGDFVLVASDRFQGFFGPDGAADRQHFRYDHKKLHLRDHGLMTLMGIPPAEGKVAEALRGATERNAILRALDAVCAPHLVRPPLQAPHTRWIASLFTWQDGGAVRAGLSVIDDYYMEIEPGKSRALLTSLVPAETRRKVDATLKRAVRPSRADAVPYYARLACDLMAEVSTVCDTVSERCDIGVHERGKLPRIWAGEDWIDS